MSERDDLNAARGIARGCLYSIVIWLLIALAVSVLAGCSLNPGHDCVRYGMRGDCERPLFEDRGNYRE